MALIDDDIRYTPWAFAFEFVSFVFENIPINNPIIEF